MLNFVLASYRIVATSVVALPIIINYLEQGGIIASLIYIPLLSLSMALITIAADKKVIKFLHHIKQNQGIRHTEKTNILALISGQRLLHCPLCS